MDTVELRSDTFTLPTPEMRRAMAEAEVGDDVWGEDPTVNALQDHCAALLGKEAGLFVSSGTMGNELAIAAQTAPGDEVIVEETCHIMEAEVGGPARISQVMVRALPSVRGVFGPAQLVGALRPPSRWFSHTALLCLENTHQSSGGAVIPLAAFREMCAVAHDADVKVHLDGARIFNAAVAAGIDARLYAAEVDTLSFCFSKGLGAPIGSMLLGPREVIDRARKVRRLLGGGLRQSGVIAAAARVAIDTMVERLHDDHVNARALADGISTFWPSAVDAASVESNIVYLDTGERSAVDLTARLEQDGVKVGAMGQNRIRCVTHKDVDAAGIARAVDALRGAI